MKNTTMTTEVNTCHLCDGRSFITIEQRDFTYKGEVFNVKQYFYKCQSCGEEYTTDELDSETMRQVYFEYWKNHVDDGVLFDNVITDLDKPKTFAEYKYMLEHHSIYTKEELKLVLVNFLNNCEIENYSDLIGNYTDALNALKNG